jgi:hypothetical protein
VTYLGVALPRLAAPWLLVLVYRTSGRHDGTL